MYAMVANSLDQSRIGEGMAKIGVVKSVTAIFGPLLFGMIFYPNLAGAGVGWIVFLLAGALSISVYPIAIGPLAAPLRFKEYKSLRSRGTMGMIQEHRAGTMA